MKAANTPDNDFSASVPYKREEFFSKDGYEISIASEIWRLNKDVSFDLIGLLSG